MNVAVTDFAAFMLTVQVPVPEHPALPLQPAKVEPVACAADSVTLVFAAYEALHVLPQLMPLPLTVPAPAPVLLTLSV